MFNWLFPKKADPFRKSVYIPALIIEAFSSDSPSGSCQASKIGAAIVKISSTRDKDGKIWLDKDVAWHELQHLCAGYDAEFGQPDDNRI